MDVRLVRHLGRFALLAALFGGLGVPAPAHALRHLAAGDAAPDPALVAEGGTPAPLSAHLGEKGALVVFWASWNPRSSEILAYLAGLGERYRPHGLRVLPVNAEREALGGDEMQALGRLYGGWGLPWPTHFDPGLDAFDAFGVMALPTSIYVGRDGRLAGFYPGFPAEAREALPELVEKGLGIWSPPVAVRRPLEVRHQPKGAAGPLFRQGQRLFERGMPARALEVVDRAGSADPDFAVAQAVGVFLAGRSRAGADADGRLEALRARSHGEPAFREALGVALLSVGREEEAIEELLPLLDAPEPRPRGLVALGLARAGRGDPHGAEEVLRRLEAWPLGGVPLEIDVGAYLDPDVSPDARWSDREAVLLRLLDLRSRDP
ncbi:MAG: redoxin family protein [Thermodesulfobacteriota bacterium]